MVPSSRPSMRALALLVMLLGVFPSVRAQAGEAVVAAITNAESMTESLAAATSDKETKPKDAAPCAADACTDENVSVDAASSSSNDINTENQDPVPLTTNHIMDKAHTFSDLWEDLQCDDYFETAQRPSNHTPVWTRLRQLYLDTMQIPPESPTYISMKTIPSAIQIPYEVKSAGHKGLGLFATANAPKGALLDDAARGGRAHFLQGDDFRRFVAQATSWADRCLILQCAGVESDLWYEEDDEKAMEGAFISVDLDDSCFMNGESFEGEANTGWPFADGHFPTDRELLEEHGGCTRQHCAWALKDVHVGDELITPYDEYVFVLGFEHFDL